MQDNKKKTKKESKVRDLKPKKDAKGGTASSKSATGFTGPGHGVRPDIRAGSSGF